MVRWRLLSNDNGYTGWSGIIIRNRPMRFLYLITLMSVSLISQNSVAVEAAFKQVGPAKLMLDPKRARVVQTSENTFSIVSYAKDVYEGSHWRCACEGKAKKCETKITQTSVECGGPRCCGMITWDTDGNSFRAQQSVCP